MKKLKLIGLSALLTIGLFTVVTGCYVDRHNDYFYGYVSFWNDNNSYSDIVITVDGTVSQTINKVSFYEPGSCNLPGNANFYLIEGYHQFSARTVNGTYLGNGDFNVTNDCKIVYVD